MKKLQKLRRAAMVLAFLSVAAAAYSAGTEGFQPQVIPLAGPWQIRLDRNSNQGVGEGWFNERFDGPTIALPGTVRGPIPGLSPNTKPESPDDSSQGLGNFTMLYDYWGAAWYQREVEIPADWKGRHIELFLESCMGESWVWVDGKPQGTHNSLATPQVFDLTGSLAPGKHLITIALDNSNKPDAMSGMAGVTAAPVRDTTERSGRSILKSSGTALKSVVC